MPLLIYAYDADALPSLLEETADAEEAVAACRALVEEEGYPRAEVWSAAGDRLYGVLRAGERVLTIGSASDVLASAPHQAPDHEARPARPSGPVERPLPTPPSTVLVGDAAHAPHAPPPLVPLDAPDRTPMPPAPDDLLGPPPARGEVWFGL